MVHPRNDEPKGPLVRRMTCGNGYGVDDLPPMPKVNLTRAAHARPGLAKTLDVSLECIGSVGLALDAPLVDVGGAASTLVDDLLNLGHTHLSVLDISGTALEVAKKRLAERATSVRWLCGDASELPLPAKFYVFWHDRAVFHFLTDPAQRRAYIAQLKHALVAGGHVLIGTFGPNGPTKCSGLEVLRLSADDIHAELGKPFVKVASSVEMHVTPDGGEQEFVYCLCRLDG